MASGDTGRTLTAYFSSMGSGFDHTVDSPRTWSSSRTYRPPLNAKQKSQSTAEDEPKDFTPSRAAVIGQWICFVLGVVCVACGAFGVFANQIQGPSSAFVAWLGPAHLPAQRIAALLCLFMGVLSMRRGWSSPEVTERKEHEK
jgi:hypothetical protein